MTEFLDVLETQLTGAARRRHRRRRRLPLPRIGFEALVAGAVVAAGVALVVALGGPASETHDGRTPAAPGGVATELSPRGANARVVVLDWGEDPGRAASIARRLTAGGATVVRTVDSPERYPLGLTAVQYRPGAAGAALAVSRFVGGISAQDAGMRVEPLGPRTARTVGDRDYDVIVLVGLDDHGGGVQLEAGQSVLKFAEGCRPGFDDLGGIELEHAYKALLHHWPAADGAVVRSARYESDACGAGRTIAVDLLLTRYEGDPQRSDVTVFMSSVDGCWFVRRQRGS